MGRRAARGGAGGGGGGAPPGTDPIDFLTDLQIWIRPDPGFVSDTGGLIDSIVNRGLLGGTANATLTDRPTLIASDANFNGAPSIDYDASTQQRLLLPSIAGLSAFHIFHLTRKNSVPPTVGAGGIHILGTSSSRDHYPLNGTSIYMGAGSDTRRGPLTFSGNLTLPNVLEVLSTASEYTVTLNWGETLFTDGTNTPAGEATPTMGGILTGTVLQDGQTVELIICSSQQSVAQLNLLYAYFDDRYAIISQLVVPPPDPDPGILAKLTAWYRADLGVTLNAGRVETWGNILLGGSANDLTQSVPGERPVVNAAAINGQDAILFDDANSEHLAVTAGGSFAGAAEFFNVLMVARTDDTGQNNQTYVRADNGGVIHRVQQNNGNLQSNIADPGNSTINAANNTTAFQVIRAQYDGVTHRLFVDEVEVGSDALAGAQSAVTELSVGAVAGGMRPFSGEIAELFVSDEPFTAADLELFQFYFDKRYGLLSPP